MRQEKLQISGRSVFEVIRRTVLKQKILSMGIVLAVVGAIVTALLPPWILGSIVDSITGGNNVPVTLILLYFQPFYSI